ncbi:MAG TPA: UDP-N-acetylmuramate--L-alanine ligase [Bacteroidales bacterium]|nr:MAG: UDP-N-acetylmuramate--L-alanine ligase [Bacteroidetes bacterium GWE2_42_24]OFY29323.1 MAG: UDP-N-acetylmuramate--L-alanine ligase [Bacteroidetes bacterium GWF2_43_11]HBZ66780.1 UDP-N-acetylmuramate--L-alanine ligase [Bacteroidales bacterium]
MRINDINHIYFLGIGGIGMSAIARFFKWKGADVSGYDRTPSHLTEELQKEGISVWFDESPTLIPGNIDLVVITPAIPVNHRGLVHLKNKGLPIVKRSELLGIITGEGKTIAVAGTHGKTTTSTLTAHILYQSEIGCNAFLGGISKNYQNNLLISDHPTPWMVTEADEFDRSFLQLYPFIATITATDADHLDIYGTHQALLDSFQQFTQQIQPGGFLILKTGTPLDIINKSLTVYTYSIDDETTDCHAANITFDGTRYHFDLVMPRRIIPDLCPGIPAKVNVENAVAACTMAALAGCSDNEIRSALSTFSGIRRRFDLRINEGGRVYIDDYAHHPEEIKALISSVRHMYPNRKITGVFQPHLFSRTRDFAEGFALELSKLDECYLLDIYPARELPIKGITSQFVADRMTAEPKVVSVKALLPIIEDKKPEVLLTIGAGDIDKLVEPLEIIIRNQIKQSNGKI